MERIVFDRMADLDTRHWWYRARRDVLAKLIERKVHPPANAQILEIGCATGHNLPMLSRFGTVAAVELDPDARAIATQRLGRPVAAARLPDLEGVPEGQYDLVALLDVLEHVEEDRAALMSIAQRLKPGGALLITVPAFPWMWSVHDELNHHKRRYTKKTLRAAIADAGLQLGFMGYFNSILFPLVVAGRQIGRMTGKLDSDDKMPAKPVNAVLQTIFGLERHVIGRLPFSPGVSIAAVVRAG